MKFSAVLGAVLGASAVAAAPGTAKRRERAARKLAERQARQSGLMIPDTQETDELAIVNGTKHVSYSTNWAGAVKIGTGYTSVTGTFTVPTPKVPSGGSSAKTYSASAWVGIDGDTCTSAILQTGIDFNVEAGKVTYDAWYEWYPQYAYDFTGITISAGDQIKTTVTATSKTTGTAVVENLTTGKSVTHTFRGASTASLCETNAEWIVEDFEEGSSLVPFADFDTVTFTDATVNGAGVTGATIIDIRQSAQVLTSCAASGTTVTCSYV
ncbi:Peptidase A4 family protein [Seiridium cupressi]